MSLVRHPAIFDKGLGYSDDCTANTEPPSGSF